MAVMMQRSRQPLEQVYGVLKQASEESRKAIAFTQAAQTSRACESAQYANAFTVNFNLAMVAMQQGKLVEAADYLDKAQDALDKSGQRQISKISANTHQVNLYVNMALVHSKLRNATRAQKAIEEAQARMPLN